MNASERPDTGLSLDGTGVRLRDPKPSDYDDIVKWTGPGLAWQRYDAPWEPVEPQADTPERREAFGLRCEAIRASGLPRTRLEIEARGSERHLGWVNRYWVDERTGWLEVGIDICEETEWGRGYGREAMELWLDYLFDVLGLARVGLGTWSGNARMLGLAYGLGFRPEARVRRARIVDGIHYDAVKLGILRDEWRAVRDRHVHDVAEAGTVTVRPGPDPHLLVVWNAGYGDPSLPKGRIEPGESPAEAAVRETAEETGLRVRLLSTRPVEVTGVAVEHRPWLRRRISFFPAEPLGDVPEADLHSFRRPPGEGRAGLGGSIAASSWLPLLQAELAFRQPECLAALTKLVRGPSGQTV
ncbi:MAG: GNAT family N-acetyltransferase [Bacillota bacterium]|nr:MAG: GNAT family N-acetyltransferase [Bacillota bacterium]